MPDRHIYTPEEIERLKKLPGVVTVTSMKIVYDLEFKQELYDEWIIRPEISTVLQSFRARGVQLERCDYHIVRSLHAAFKQNGRPFFQMPTPVGDGMEHMTKDELIEAGVLDRTLTGFRISKAYLEQIKQAYWAANEEKTVDELVRESGYNPSDLGRSRIKNVQRSLLNDASKSKKTPDIGEQKPKMGNELGKQKAKSPGLIWTRYQVEETQFIHNVKADCLELTEAFLNDAVQFIDLPVPDILSIYCIPEDAVPTSYFDLIKKWLHEWEPNGEVVTFDLPVAVNRFVAMRRLLEQALAEAREDFQLMTPPEKKATCEVIDKLSRDPIGEYTTQAVREKIGISQTAYYKYLRRERYGMKRTTKAVSDVEAVRKVFEYKGFKKGSRQIYMLMPKVVGRKMGLKKIRRIMQENGMESDIRTPNKQKRAMEKYLKENRKPNLLDRRFRLYRPNQIRLTDVTYIDYGPKGKEKQRAYGSASIDPVTGKLIAFVVMDKNDQKLADATLREMDNYPCEFGGKFHSDQGTLYLTPEFQAKVAERGFDQSMSRRSNCWDNAPQESFFGHFKDECDYASCETLDELRAMIEVYKYYFNYERGMWDRMQMTPVDYEKYLNSLSDEEFQKYLDVEEIRYREMKAESIRKAKAHAKDLGAYESEDLGTEDDLNDQPDDDHTEGGGDDE